MEKTRAKLTNAKISPQKMRLVADQIRGLHINKALDILNFSNKKASEIIVKVLNSAIANAENNNGADIDELYISEIFVDAGPTMKRIKPRARGRADRIIKRSSHVTIAVSEGL